jgi:hydrogenase maturation protease
VPTLVVGIGHEDRGDDAAGPLTARLLARAWGDRLPPHVAVCAWRGDPLGLIDAWAGVERLVIVDAVVSGGAPGTCRRFGVDAPFATGAGASTHGIGLADALALARTLGRLPPTVEVWGIEADAFTAGALPSAAVARAAADLAARLAATLGAGDDAPARGRQGVVGG